MSCVFCDIAAKRVDADLTVFEDEHVFAQMSLRQKPGNHGHALVIPKRHIVNIYETTAELDAPLIAAVRLLSRATKKAFAAEGISVRQNNEPAADQDVFHLHFHVIPRYRDDGFVAKPYEVLPRDIREALSARLRAAIREEQNGPPA